MITVTGHQDGPPAPRAAGGGGGQPASGPADPAPTRAFATFLGTPEEAHGDTSETTTPDAGPVEAAPLLGVVPAGTTPAPPLKGHIGAAGQGQAAKVEASQVPQGAGLPPEDAAAPHPAVALAGDDGVSSVALASPGGASVTAQTSSRSVPLSATLHDAPPEGVIARGAHGDPVPARPPETGQGRVAVAAGAFAAIPSTIAPETALPSGMMQVMAALHAAEPPAAAPRQRIVAASSRPGVVPPALHTAPPPDDLSTVPGTAMAAAADPLGLADAISDLTGSRASAPLAPAPAPASLPATAGLDIPRQIAVQIAHAAEAGGGVRGTIELSLSPEELGRVRLRLHPSEAGLSVTITADRPETLDLMRRNIDLLAREFVQIGYEGTQFDFTQGGQGTDQDQAPPFDAAAPALTTAPPDIAPLAPAALIVLGDRLDIRL